MTIEKVLVANRGEIARRVFRTCRAMGIATVAVYSEPDHGEPHMLEADEAVALTGSTPTGTYLDIEAIISAAKETGADAIHPGYGFLAESAAFARAVLSAGLVWIGPSPESIEIMGSKLESKRVMDETGVPTLAAIRIDDDTEPADAAGRLGYPVLVKASAGGGGKGMRIVESAQALGDAIDGAKRESLAAFGDDTVFLERYLVAPRHIEIQVFGDTQGNVISLFERECSIQRRHQKIIEESPSPALDEVTRDAMSAAAREAARAVDYVGAGTVEFLFQDGAFYFLEMNTRLQVEHPVTELLTGLDLVELQLRVANGEALDPAPKTTSGHAIEARLYAEDPLNDFLPVTGPIHRFRLEETEGIRVDSGVEDGSTVSVHYDPMLAKVIAHAPTRRAAAGLLSSSLRKAQIHGATNNLSLLVRILEHDEFLAGDTDTHFLDRNDPSELSVPLADAGQESLAAVAAAIADQAHARSEAVALAGLPSGWRNMAGSLQQRDYEGWHGRHTIRYSIDRGGIDVDGLGEVFVSEGRADGATLEVGATEHEFAVARYGELRFVDGPEGPVRLVEAARFPIRAPEDDVGSLHAPMPGKILSINSSEGEKVFEGEVLIVMEAMKMEHSLRAPHAGTLTELRCRVGDQVDADAVLALVEVAG